MAGLPVETCLACGGPIGPGLQETGSVRCQDCRDAHAPLRPDLVEPGPAPVRVQPAA